MSKIYLKEKTMQLNHQASEALESYFKNTKWEFAPIRCDHNFYKRNKFKINWIYTNESYSFLFTDAGFFKFGQEVNFSKEEMRERFFRKTIGKSIKEIDFASKVVLFDDTKMFFCRGERPKFFYKDDMVNPHLCNKPPAIVNRWIEEQEILDFIENLIHTRDEKIKKMTKETEEDSPHSILEAMRYSLGDTLIKMEKQIEQEEKQREEHEKKQKEDLKMTKEVKRKFTVDIELTEELFDELQKQKDPKQYINDHIFCCLFEDVKYRKFKDNFKSHVRMW